MIKRSQTKIF